MQKRGNYGFDVGDDMAFLLDLRFADDILLFARTPAQAMALLDDLMHKPPNIGLHRTQEINCFDLRGSAATFLAYPH